MGPHLTTAKHPPLERLKKKQPPLKKDCQTPSSGKIEEKTTSFKMKTAKHPPLKEIYQP